MRDGADKSEREREREHDAHEKCLTAGERARCLTRLVAGIREAAHGAHEREHDAHEKSLLTGEIEHDARRDR